MATSSWGPAQTSSSERYNVTPPTRGSSAIIAYGPVPVDPPVRRWRKNDAVNPVLTDMTRLFQSAQTRWVAIRTEALGPALRVRLPASNHEWVSICKKYALYK